MSYRYWSDLHLFHKNIIEYCRRPFASIEDMNLALLRAWRNCAEEFPDDKVINLGDLQLLNRYEMSKCFMSPLVVLDLPKQHMLVLGNHDNGKVQKSHGFYDIFFDRVVGSSDLQDEFSIYHEDGEHRILLSHAPVHPSLLVGGLINLHGHYHNALRDEPDEVMKFCPWLNGSDRHFSCCVEVLGYYPRTIDEVFHLNKEFHGQ